MGKNLRLNLKAKWYNMIESGVKKEEYREIKPFWLARLVSVDGIRQNQNYWNMGNKNKFLESVKNNWYWGEFVKYDTVTFVYGYTKKTMSFEIENITIGKGKPEWGGVDEDVFIIKLGAKL